MNAISASLLHGGNLSKISDGARLLLGWQSSLMIALPWTVPRSQQQSCFSDLNIGMLYRVVIGGILLYISRQPYQRFIPARAGNSCQGFSANALIA
jgi:hypothetical protein